MSKVFVDKLPNSNYSIGYEKHGSTRFMELTRDELYEIYTKCSYMFSKEKFNKLMEGRENY